MYSSATRKVLSVLAAALLLVMVIAPAVTAADERPEPTGVSPVLIHYDESVDQEGLTERLGVAIAEDYGSFALADVTPEVREWLEFTGITVTPLDDISRISLSTVEFDTTEGEPALPPGLTNPSTGAGWYLVQFKGPVKAEWLAQLQANGDVVGYVPNFAYLAFLGASARESVPTWPNVRWVGAFHPAYRLAPDLVDGQFMVEFFPGYGTPDALAQLQQAGLAVLGAEGDRAAVQGTVAQTQAAATMAEVLYIEQSLTPETQNSTARTVIRSDVPHGKGINGRPSSQIVAITDTGMWTAHEAFSEPGKIAAFIDIAGDGGSSGGDGHGHGTHVACSALGDAPASGAYLTYNKWDGQSFGSRAVAVKVFNNAGFWAGGSNYYDIWHRAYNVGARVNSNSWGSASNGAYGASDRDADRVTWDHRDYVLSMAAGNYGASGARTVISPSNAKNVIAVGATETPLPQNVASFSSRGATVDNRIKPDVMAPGQTIHSAQRGVVTGYIDMAGTSMATPQVSGSAALVREYFMRGFYPSGVANPTNALTPKAALVKAMLINGAQEMTGTRSDWNSEGKWPNCAQGWGRINLDRSLYFANDTRHLVAWDNPASLATGARWTDTFAVGDGAQDVKVTLTWTDYPATSGAAVTIINNLDLKVTAPDGRVFYGNNFVHLNPGHSVTGGGYNNRDTVEGVHLVPNHSFPGNLPTGTYTITVTAANMPQPTSNFAVVVSGGVFEPPPEPNKQVAIMGDYNYMLRDFLEGVGYPVKCYSSSDYATVIANLDAHDVVILNRVANATGFDQLYNAANTKQKGLIFCGSWPVTSHGMGVLQLRKADPTTTSNYWEAGPVVTRVLAAHPVFNGYSVNQLVTLINGGDNDYQTYNGYGGSDIGANNMPSGNPYMIGAKDRALTGGARHVVLGSLGACAYTNTRHWTVDGQQVFVNAVEWASGNPPPPPLTRARVAIMGDYNNQLRDYLTGVGYRVTSYAQGDYAGVIGNMPNLDAVLLHRVDNAPGFNNLLAQAAATGRGLVFLSAFPVLNHGMGVLSLRQADPATVAHHWRYGPVRFQVAQAHPVLLGYTVGAPVTIINGGDWDFQTYNSYTGTTLGTSLMPVGLPGMIGVKDRVATGGARHVVLGSFGATVFTNVGHWTPDAKQILKNAIEWAKFGAP